MEKGEGIKVKNKTKNLGTLVNLLFAAGIIISTSLMLKFFLIELYFDISY